MMGWFADLGSDMAEFNQSLVLRVPAALDFDRLGTALRAVLDRHDALRMRVAGDWTIEVPEPGSVTPADCLVRFDAVGLDESAVRSAVTEQARAARSAWLRRTAACSRRSGWTGAPPRTVCSSWSPTTWSWTASPGASSSRTWRPPTPATPWHPWAHRGAGGRWPSPTSPGSRGPRRSWNTGVRYSATPARPARGPRAGHPRDRGRDHRRARRGHHRGPAHLGPRRLPRDHQRTCS